MERALACLPTAFVWLADIPSVSIFSGVKEIRCLQLESAVLKICAHHGHEAEFVAGDLLGSLYGANQYEILWKVNA